MSDSLLVATARPDGVDALFGDYETAWYDLYLSRIPILDVSYTDGAAEHALVAVRALAMPTLLLVPCAGWDEQDDFLAAVSALPHAIWWPAAHESTIARLIATGTPQRRYVGANLAQALRSLGFSSRIRIAT